MYLEG